MTRLLCLFSILISLISCNRNQLSHEQIVRNYYKELNAGNFESISNYISDSLVRIDNNYLLSQSKLEFYQFFRWDSVFQPKYTLIEIKDTGNSIKAIVSKICKRIEFLQDSAIILDITVDFNKGKISKINTTKYLFFDNTKWQPRRDTLLGWIDKTHPELSGFFNDLTPKGAQNYLKAIELFKTEYGN